MDLQRINQMVDNGMSSFQGSGINSSDGYYTGFADDFVDFGGQGLDFARSVAANRQFIITISNQTGADKTIVLFEAYYAAAYATGTLLAADGTIATSLTGTGSPSTIAEMHAWVMANPTHVPVLRVSSTLSSQLQQTLYIRRKSPFKTLQDDFIAIGAYVSEANNNDKLVTVQRPFQLDNQTQVSIIIPSTAVTTFTFYCGAVLNTAAALNGKFNAAAQNSGVAPRV